MEDAAPIVTAWSPAYPSGDDDLRDRREGPVTGLLDRSHGPDWWVRGCLVDPATVGDVLPVDLTGPTVALVPTPWEWPGDARSSTFVELSGPMGHAGFVHATLAPHGAWPPETAKGREALASACTHLLARAVRAAFESGVLVVPESGLGRRYDIEVDLDVVEELIRSGAQLVEIFENDDKVPLGWGAADDNEDYLGELTFHHLVSVEKGAVLRLEVDGNYERLLTFDITVPADVIESCRPVPELSPTDPFWRAVTMVAVDVIQAMDAAGRIGHRVQDVVMTVDLDAVEADRISRDPPALAEFIASYPTRWQWHSRSVLDDESFWGD